MNKNNIFTFATKELSQDAFLCWIANWYNYDSPLSSLSKDFLSLILLRSGNINTTIESVNVFRQYNKIDILILVNKAIAIIIEDKTNSTEHDAQIRKYEKDIKQNGIYISKEITVKVDEVICVYYKTAPYVFEDERILSDDSIIKIFRNDMLSLVYPYISYSEIINDYYLYLKEIDDNYIDLTNEYNRYDYTNAMQHSHLQYRFIKDCFSEDGSAAKLPKHSSIPNLEPVIQQGTTYGWPYTWYWILEFSKDIPEDNRREFGRYLGFRVDNDVKQGPYIAFKMYCKYDKNDNAKKELQNKEFTKIQNALSKITSLHSNINVHIKNYSFASNNECEFLRCYFKENISDYESFDQFTHFLRSIANTFDLFSPLF